MRRLRRKSTDWRRRLLRLQLPLKTQRAADRIEQRRSLRRMLMVTFRLRESKRKTLPLM